MKAVVVTEAITFYQHMSADDSIIQQAISTWQADGVSTVTKWGFGITQLIRKLSGKHTVAEKIAALHSSTANT